MVVRISLCPINCHGLELLFALCFQYNVIIFASQAERRVSLELGNAVFGCSRGKFEFPCEFKTSLNYLYERVTNRGMFDYSGRAEYISDLFEMHEYYYGDCTCKFDESAAEWDRTHHHSENCYQKLVENELLTNHSDLFYQDPLLGGYRQLHSASYDKCIEVERAVRKKLCNRFGLTFPEGSAVHCTCSFDKEYQEWSSKNNHDPKCLIVRPNFWYKPQDVKVMWYKHIGRDSYINKELTLKQFFKIIDECVASL